MRKSGPTALSDGVRRWRWAVITVMVLPLVAVACRKASEPEPKTSDRTTDEEETGQPAEARSWCKLTLDGTNYQSQACHARLLRKSGVDEAVQAHDVLQVTTSRSMDSPRYPHLFLEAEVQGADFRTLQDQPTRARCFVRTAASAPVGQPLAQERVTLTITRVGKSFVGGEFEGQVVLTGSETPVPIRGSFKAWAKAE